MAKPRPGKEAKAVPTQAQLPGMPPPPPPGTTRVLPMQLQPGDRLTDATGEWEVVGGPTPPIAGRTLVSGSSGDKPGVTEIRMWGAYEKVSVKRTISKEWNRIEERP